MFHLIGVYTPVLEHFMFQTSFHFSGFDGYKQTTSITNVIAYLDLNVIKVGTGAQVLQGRKHHMVVQKCSKAGRVKRRNSC